MAASCLCLQWLALQKSLCCAIAAAMLAALSKAWMHICRCPSGNAANMTAAAAAAACALAFVCCRGKLYGMQKVHMLQNCLTDLGC